MSKSRHFVTNANDGRGDCAHCGPSVEMLWRADVERWLCATGRREQRHTSIGKFDDSPELLLRAADYITRNRAL